MAISQQKILFARYGSFSHINPKVRGQLESNFPEFTIEEVDVWQLLKRKIVSANPLAMIQDYGLREFIRRGDPKDCLLQSRRGFALVQGEMRRRFEGGNWAFSFQTQSLFDAALPGIPHFVYTDHTELANLRYPAFVSRNLMKKWWIDLEQQIYRNADVTFTMSSHVSDSLLEDYGCKAGRVECVFAGSNSSVPDNVSHEIERYRRKIILFVGVDWERKGGPAVLAAFRSVLTKHPEATLRIVGCSPQIDCRNCEVLGRLPLSELPAQYREASIFCLPTRIEPFGIAFLEAMHAGLPVVASDIGAVKDFLIDGHNGYRVREADLEGLITRLDQLLASPEEMRRMGINSSERASHNYTWEGTGRRIAETIRQKAFPADHFPVAAASRLPQVA